MSSNEDAIKLIKETSWSAESIPLELVRTWMQNPDIQVQGAAWGFIVSDPHTWDRTYPIPSIEEADKFLFSFFERCLNEDPQGKYAPNQQQAADEILRWFWHREEQVFEQHFLNSMKSWLEKTYLAGNDQLRKVIADTVLNGLLEKRRWRDRLEDWMIHPELRKAYIPIAERASAHAEETEATIESIKAFASSKENICSDIVQSWMNHKELEVQGATWRLIATNADALAGVQPAITAEEIEEFSFLFFGKCLHFETPDGNWAMNRYFGSSKIRHLFWAADINNDQEALVRLKDRLKSTYLRVNPFARRSIAYDTLEPLFGEQKWRDFFADWEDHPDLSEAYLLASEEELCDSLPVEAQIIEIKFLVNNAEIVPLQTVQSWLKSDDIEVLGAAFHLIIAQRASQKRIAPALSTEEIDNFYVRFYGLCLKADPDSEWGLTRFETLRDFYLWYSSGTEESEFLLRLKQLLAETYLKSDEDTQNAIICGALEHILEEKRWQTYFEDWRDNPTLKEAYESAMEWAVSHER